MAPTLLQKLFNKRGGGAASAQARPPKEEPAFSWSCSEFGLSDIRLLVYQDCERRGRQVMFDSRAVQKMEEAAAQKAEDVPIKMSARCCQESSSSGGGSSSSGSSSSHGFGGSLQHAKQQLPKYQYTRPASDVSMLGEMMFGSVAMSYKGSTLKIHYIRSPPQLMISKVFSATMGSFCGSTNNLQDSFEYINQDPQAGKLNTNQYNLGPFRTGSNLGLLQVCSGKLLQGLSEGGPLRLTRSASFFAAHSTPVDMPSRGQNEDRDSGIARSGARVCRNDWKFSAWTLCFSQFLTYTWLLFQGHLFFTLGNPGILNICLSCSGFNPGSNCDASDTASMHGDSRTGEL